MIKRLYWIQQVTRALESRSLLWLSGVRRSGKTTLCKSLQGVEYFDCELPRVRRALEDPEFFFLQILQRGADKPQILVFDEIHRLQNPSELLKIAADHFPEIKVIATGSSVLAVSKKFKDTLTGRKNQLLLTPLCLQDLQDFGDLDMSHRMLRGGLPPFFQSAALNDVHYKEWMDSYWAKDVQELFTVEKKAAFLKFAELLFFQSGELFEAQRFTTPCEISRQTVQNYLEILESTLLFRSLRPFFGTSANEIKAQRKVYAFDTGFLSYFKSWENVDSSNKGTLLEHMVLNELTSFFQNQEIYYWRDKQKHEIDFIISTGRNEKVLAIECKSKAGKFALNNLDCFRTNHPNGENWVVCLDKIKIEFLKCGSHIVTFIPLALLHTHLLSKSTRVI